MYGTELQHFTNRRYIALESTLDRRVHSFIMISDSMEVVVSTDVDDADIPDEALGEVNPVPIEMEDEDHLRVSPSRSRLSASDVISMSSSHPDLPSSHYPDISFAMSTTSSTRARISDSVENLLLNSDLANCRNRLSKHGYETMKSLRLASKEDLVAIGLPRGYAGLLLYAVAQEDKGHGPGTGLAQIQ